ncbi:uncharacterized protein LAJ45_11420 [Morchella importuna]|uniref:uncharacterized protein n=1 Tax=Morchella importuna TaxID=1174673 RepID=UPI001E8DCEEF|nr:uncharacterized protein LAJ45_11420 [Morchella importuna]KAH8144585.1 hypothetical protein LAJ45_11420 [Morchella importuna]
MSSSSSTPNHPREHPTTLRKLLASPTLTRPKDWWRSQCVLYELSAPAKGTIKTYRDALEAAMKRPGGLDGVVRPVFKERKDPLKSVVGAKVSKTKPKPRSGATGKKGAEPKTPQRAPGTPKPRTVLKTTRVTRSMRLEVTEEVTVVESAMDFEMEYETEYREQFRKLNTEGRVDEHVRRRRETLFYGVDESVEF